MRLLASELRKLLTSRTLWTGAIIAAGIGAVLTVFTGVTLLAAPSQAMDRAFVTGLYVDTIYLAWILPLFLGVLLATNEFRIGTAVQTFLQTPRREKVLWGKMLVSALGGVVSAVSSLLGAAVTASLFLLTAPESVGPDGAVIGSAVVGLVLTSAALAPLGVALGMLVRAQLAGLGIVVGWLFLAENLLGALLGSLAAYLPGQLVLVTVTMPPALETLTNAFSGGVTPLLGWLVLVAWAVVVGVVAQVTTLRRDID